jgi:Zn-dependent protease
MNDIVYSAAVWIVPLIFAIVLHEVSHGWVANAFGDPTAKQLGRLSVNPIRHVDPVGTILLPLVLAVAHAPIFGWAKPVPVVAARMRHPRWQMPLVALAGPGINLLLAAATAVVLGILANAWQGTDPAGTSQFFGEMLVNFILVNVFLALFNLLPMPPFDGGHVVEALLPRPLAARWVQAGRYAFPVLILLLVVVPMIKPDWDIVARLVVPPARAVSGFFLGIAAAI